MNIKKIKLVCLFFALIFNFIILGNVTYAQSSYPVLTSISPSSGIQGETLEVSLNGTNFGSYLARPTVSFGPDITVDSSRLITPSKIIVRITIGDNAQGQYNVILTSAGQTTYPQTFTVTIPPHCTTPSIYSIAPSLLSANSKENTLTIFGSNFTKGTYAYLNGYSRETNFINPNKLTMFLTTRDLAIPKDGNIVVSNGVNCISNSAIIKINYSTGSGDWLVHPTPTYYASVLTKQTNEVTDISAILYGTVDPKKYLTTTWFEYSNTPDFAKFTETEHLSLDVIDKPSDLSQTIKDLTPKTNYYFRIVAENNSGVTKGNIISFTTKEKIALADSPLASTDPKVSVSGFLNKQKSNFSLSIIGWAILIIVIVMAIAYFIAKRRSR